MPAKKTAKPASQTKRPSKQSRVGRKDFSQVALSVVEKATGARLKSR